MSGHSKWSTIKHKKSLMDNKRGQIFTKLARAVTIATKEGGGADLSTNFKLRLAVEKAKQFNMPKKNIEKAIERGSSKGGGDGFFEVVYEGYGPGKSAVMVEVVTDNKNRTVAEIKKEFDRAGGSLGQTGSVNFLFARKGRLVVKKSQDEEEMMLALIDLGVEDVEVGEQGLEVLVAADKLFEVKEKIERAGMSVLEAEQVFVPKTAMQLEESLKSKVLGFLEALDELDDVQNIYCNVAL